jgi:hypothetical protein
MSKKFFLIFKFSFLFGGTQGFMVAKQALCHLRYTSSPNAKKI